MLRSSKFLPLYLLFFSCLVLCCATSAWAGEKEERVRSLKEKLQALQQQLTTMQEEEMRMQPPTETPWQPILTLGDERPAYAHYVYLLGAQMSQQDLDDVLQQVYHLSSQDPLEKKGALFVIPARSLAAGEQMSVASYNRELAISLLRQAGIPSAVEGGLLISTKPLDKIAEGDETSQLFIDLADFDLVLRARALESLLSKEVFAPDGTPHGFLWTLLKGASPQAFKIYFQNDLVWVSAAR